MKYLLIFICLFLYGCNKDTDPEANQSYVDKDGNEYYISLPCGVYYANLEIIVNVTNPDLTANKNLKLKSTMNGAEYAAISTGVKCAGKPSFWIEKISGRVSNEK